VLQTIRRLLIRPGCFRLERELPGGVCTHDINAPWQGTQWNSIEHKLFAFISMNWRGKPLRDRATIIRLISATKTKAGLSVECRMDDRVYETGITISDEDFRSINIVPNENFHPEWNYTIYPRGWNIAADQRRELPKPES
jgi:Rhodopirellula transposase DDE domain